MALFGVKKTKDSKEEKKTKDLENKNEKAEEVSSGESLKKPDSNFLSDRIFSSDVILRPRITEKATDKQQENVYVFEIYPNATKRTVSEVIHNIYKVTPRKVNIVKTPAKRVSVRGKRGMKKSVKKAYVYLKEGDRIEVI